MHQSPIPKSYPWYLWLDIKHPARPWFQVSRNALRQCSEKPKVGTVTLLIRTHWHGPIRLPRLFDVLEWAEHRDGLFPLASRLMNKTSVRVGTELDFWIQEQKWCRITGHITVCGPLQKTLRRQSDGLGMSHIEKLSDQHAIDWQILIVSVCTVNKLTLSSRARYFLTVDLSSDHYPCRGNEIIASFPWCILFVEFLPN